MARKNEFKEVCCKVYDVLVGCAESRDNDRLLLANVWQIEAGDIKKSHFISLLLEGTLTTPETITRARRKLQEKYTHLRGRKWNERHALQDDFWNKLKSLTDW